MPGHPAQERIQLLMLGLQTYGMSAEPTHFQLSPNTENQGEVSNRGWPSGTMPPIASFAPWGGMCFSFTQSVFPYAGSFPKWATTAVTSGQSQKSRIPSRLLMWMTRAQVLGHQLGTLTRIWIGNRGGTQSQGHCKQHLHLCTQHTARGGGEGGQI